MMDAPKLGINTTEFWMIAPTVATSLYGAVAGLIPQPWGILIATAASVIYGGLRSWVKVAHAAGVAAKIPDLPTIASAPAAPEVK